MFLLKKIFDFYLDASIHVALAIVSLIQVTALSLNITVPFSLFLLVFFGSISCYNFVKYGVEAEKYIKVANTYHKSIQLFSVCCLIISLFPLYFLFQKLNVALLILTVITGLYALPVLPQNKNFRSFSGLKIVIVALVWAGTTVVLPVLAVHLNLSWNVWLETVQRFLLVLILLVPFEIRDVKLDNVALRTLPQRLGVGNTKILGIVWCFLFLGLSFFIQNEPIVLVLSKVVLVGVLFMVIIKTKVNQTPYFSSFWVEAIPILWLCLLGFAKHYFYSVP